MLNGFKTMIIALAVTVFGALETFDFTQFLDAETSGVVVTVIGVIMAVLRTVTNSPVFNK